MCLCKEHNWCRLWEETQGGKYPIADHAPLCLYGAQIARLTYSLEPDPVAHAELLENVDLNSESSWADSIVVINGAVAPRNGDTEIGSLGHSQATR